MGRNLAVFVLFTGLGLGVYFTALANPFHYDDHHSIEFNPHIRSLANIPAFFTDPHTFSSQQSGYMFRPLLLCSYAVNYAIGGQQVEGYRWVNLLLHVGCAFLLYAWARTWDGPAPLAIGLLFLLHPVHAEPVNYISARSDLLAAFWVLLGVIALKRTEKGAIFGGGIAFVGGLLSKSSAIVLPVLLTLDGVGQRGWRWLGENRYRLGALVLVALAYIGQIWHNRFIATSLAKAPRPLDWQLYTQAKALVYYLWFYILPVDLSVDHPFVVSSSWYQPATMLASAVLLSLLWLSLRRFGHCLSRGWHWFLVALLPLSVVPLNLLVSERRSYLASAGLAVVAAWAWRRFGERRPGLAMGTGVMGLALLVLICVERNQVWASPIGLWEDAVAKGPLQFRARFNLALAYRQAGQDQEAFEQVEMGLRLKPDQADGWVLKGNLLADAKQFKAAETAYQRAVELHPSEAGIYHNLANVYQRQGDFKRAELFYREVLERNPRFVQARNNLGQAYEGLGQWRQAFNAYEKAVADSGFWASSRDPEWGGALLNLGRAAEVLGYAQRAHWAYCRGAALLAGTQYAEYARQARQACKRLETEVGP